MNKKKFLSTMVILQWVMVFMISLLYEFNKSGSNDLLFFIGVIIFIIAELIFLYILKDKKIFN